MKNILIPNKLREFRKLNNLRQIDVAHKLGLKNPDRISHWENGLSIPHPVNMFKLSAIFNTLPHELYGEFMQQVRTEVVDCKSEIVENM